MLGAASGMLVPKAEGASVAQPIACNAQLAQTLRRPPPHDFL